MKKILVSTDFSTAAKAATDVAAQIASTQFITNETVDLIVMGTAGHSKLTEMIIDPK